MATERIWLASTVREDGNPIVITNEENARRYRSTGWRVEGPYIREVESQRPKRCWLSLPTNPAEAPTVHVSRETAELLGHPDPIGPYVLMDDEAIEAYGDDRDPSIPVWRGALRRFRNA